MTAIAWIEDAPDFGWHLALAAIVDELGGQPGTTVTRAVRVADAPDADLYVAVSGQPARLAAEADDVAARAPDRLGRLVLIGAPLDFKLGFPRPPAGSFAERLERQGLAGLIDGSAVLDWHEAPSAFAGPKALLAALGSNELKAAQSPRYAIWAVAPGATLAAFLGRYATALIAAGR